MRFAKGHGTGNDFVILPDPDGRLELSASLVARLCDRHTGLGADGVLRVVRTAAAATPATFATPATPATPATFATPATLGTSATPVTPASPGTPAAVEWFMDYRNADGSVAEMCGNGVRVFVQYLLESGLAAGPEVNVLTRAGVRRVLVEPDGQLTVDMGEVRVGGEGVVQLGALQASGLAISVGNPHLACIIDGPVAAVDLAAPRLLSANGRVGEVNVEVVRIIGDREIEMRVHERGSGVTLSCGTGAVAAAVAAAATVGDWPPEQAAAWTVHVPGGTLAVTPSATASLLTGPAEIVARGELAARWLAGLSLADAATA
jgi:diaminopimelate epimerase